MIKYLILLIIQVWLWGAHWRVHVKLLNWKQVGSACSKSWGHRPFLTSVNINSNIWIIVPVFCVPVSLNDRHPWTHLFHVGVGENLYFYTSYICSVFSSFNLQIPTFSFHIYGMIHIKMWIIKTPSFNLSTCSSMPSISCSQKQVQSCSSAQVIVE